MKTVLNENSFDMFTMDKQHKNITKLMHYFDDAFYAIAHHDSKKLQKSQQKIEKLLNQVKDLIYKAYYDDMTHLLNRNGLKAKICKLCQIELEIDGVMFFIDLDRFKYINDSYGHSAGNVTLKTFAKLLTTSIQNISKNKIFISRYGGDEFIIVSEKKYTIEIDTILKTLQNKQLLIDYKKSKEVLSFSYGMALFYSGESFESIVDIADKQMYLNKKRYYTVHK